MNRSRPLSIEFTPPADQREGERGFVLLLALIAPVIPLLLILGATSQAMIARQSRLESEVLDERALVAAESGIDAAIFQASTAAGLTSGTTFSGTLGNGMSYSVTPTYLRTDLVDNDGDGLIDALDPKENVFSVLVVGTSGNTQRRLVAYLGPQTADAAVPGALTMLHPFAGSELHVQGASNINGHNTNLDGTPGNPAKDTYGVAIKAPYTLAQLLANIPSSDRTKVLGVGASPSLGQTSADIDMEATRLQVQNAANIVLTSSSYNNRQFGNGLTGTYNVIYRNGNVDFRGNTRGAGIMYINGYLHIEGTFRFDGIIYVKGDCELHGTTNIYGGVIVSATSPHFYLEGTTHVIYSTQAIGGATAVLPGKFLAFNGWQEIARR